MDELEANLEEVREMLAHLVHVSTQSKAHRESNFRKKDFRALCAWERDLTSNYGVEK